MFVMSVSSAVSSTIMSKFQAKRKKGGEEQRVIMYANILPFLSGNPLYKECCPVNFHFDLIDQENEGQPIVCAIASLGGAELPVTASTQKCKESLVHIGQNF